MAGFNGPVTYHIEGPDLRFIVSVANMPSDPVFILLFVVAAVVTIAVQRLAGPHTVALVITGLVLDGNRADIGE